VLFCVVTAVHLYAISLAINGTPNKVQLVEKWPCIDRESCRLQDLCVFISRQLLPVLMDSTHAVQVN
jgi:hypothetical protein